MYAWPVVKKYRKYRPETGLGFKVENFKNKKYKTRKKEKRKSEEIESLKSIYFYITEVIWII